MSLVNQLNYLTAPFRPFEGWLFHGLVETPEDCFGLEIEGKWYCSVFMNAHELNPVSDYESTEERQIAEGKTAVALFYGMDNTSFVRRYTPSEYWEEIAGGMTKKPFTQQPGDLYYNS